MLVQSEKIRRLSTHLLHDELLAEKRTTRLKRKSQLHLATELRLPIIPEYDAHFIVESLHPEHWSKGEAILDICKSIPGITRKEDQVSTIQQVRTLEHIDREYPHDQWIHAYTDGFAVDAMKNMGKWRIH